MSVVPALGKPVIPPPPSFRDLAQATFDRGLIGRFWANVVQVGDCWLWHGQRRSNGYGMVTVFDRGREVRFRAHRFAWEAVNGPIPPKLLVCHTCDVRRCCRPDHLFLGTMRNNSYDMMRKGRGRGRCDAKLTPEQVREVRGRLSEGVGPTDIGKAFGVKPHLVAAIRKGERYAWV